MNRKLFAFGALVAVGMTAFAGPAAAELTPWEEFCLLTSEPGEDLARCLDGLPSDGGENKVLTAPDADSPEPGAGKQTKGTLKVVPQLRTR